MLKGGGRGGWEKAGRQRRRERESKSVLMKKKFGGAPGASAPP
jgi:hypothetical protein